MLKAYLVNNPGPGGHYLEVIEGALTPTQKLIAFAVAAVLDIHVFLERHAAAKRIDNDGVVDDQLDGGKRVDFAMVAAEVLHGLAHCGQVDHGLHTVKVLLLHAGWT